MAIKQNTEYRKQKTEKGFTLIEVLMIVFILGIVVVMGGSLFFSILKGASKSEIVKEAKQNGDYALEVMERTIRNAKEITDCTTPSSITLKNSDGTATTFSCLAEDGVNKINSGTGRLTGKNVTLENPCSLSFNCQATTPPIVAISFILSQAGSSPRPEEKAKVTFQTTVSLRNY